MRSALPSKAIRATEANHLRMAGGAHAAAPMSAALRITCINATKAVIAQHITEYFNGNPPYSIPPYSSGRGASNQYKSGRGRGRGCAGQALGRPGRKPVC
jgi:hypothetical protein